MARPDRTEVRASAQNHLADAGQGETEMTPQEKMQSAKVIIAAIAAITFLELMAMWRGMNGLALSASIGGITFLAGGGTGYVIGKIRRTK